ncbi:hypothetical protein FUA23_06330 [Neolewinella aurantiaca]|uniref:Uncharacterized protein n=1 Tax=Neolewinella aurantiaca TaxID=2602767 RepID=A0A5C7FKH0_9BACT|nr:hypothetical protein [Neolewinella aurantiaca]TXF90404.1 hypothetical protein FUA23_06330 [Neolewinella aurantiaca]
MRLLFFLLTALLVSGQSFAQKLTDLPPDTDPAVFSESLEEFMNASGNKTAKDAYANFSGVFFGGGFTEEQQKRIANTSVLLAQKRISSATGFKSYLELLPFLGGTPEKENPAFAGFHDGLDLLLRDESSRTGEIVRALQNAWSYLAHQRLDANLGDDGWLVVGGAPVFSFQDGNLMMKLDTVQQLVGIGKRDTIYIDETELLVNLGEGNARGSGGRTDWKRQNLPEEVFAILVSYDIELNRTLYKSDSAQLQFPEYFDNKILIGKFTDKVEPGGARSGGEYPQFISDDGFVEIQNVGEGIDLKGNFELRGNTVYAIGTSGRKAQVTLGVQDGSGDKKIKAQADRFAIKAGETIAGQGVKTTVYFGEDSLYHPSVTLRVQVAERIAQLSRSESSADRSPFNHSLNNMQIYAERMDVYLDRDSAVVGRKTVSFEEKPDVVFESKDFFDEGDYNRLRGIAGSNPLDVIYAFRNSPEGGNDIIDANVLAKKFNPRMKAADIQPLLFDLQTKGFLLYDSESKLIELLPKVGHYVRASREEIDYDKLRLISNTSSVNAYLDLKSGEVRIDDVKPIEFNRQKQIAIKPLGNQLTVKGDRNFDFDGDIYAGGMVFQGKGFHFEYEPYRVKLDSVRYFDLFLPVDDTFGEGMKRKSTGSRIEHLSGYLLIDAPKNKSGTEDIAYFPSLQTQAKSYIYYDRADTSASYNREDFYFELEPFSLNGMDSLISTDVELEGKLFSGGIFPDMEESLTIQEDGSLGFVTQTAEGGQDAYGNHGKYEGEVSLSNRGLAGKGRLTYLEANIDSEDLSFQLDRTTATSKSFELQETSTSGREIPQVKGTEVNIEFKPYADSLIVNSEAGAPFEMFKAGAHEFQGGLVLTPEALKANGTLSWDAADMSSHDLDFSTFGAHADTANVSIKSLAGDDRLALKTTNVKADVDFETQVASFENNSSDLATALPYNEFKTSIDRFDWNMAGGNVTFQAKPGKDRFTSTNPDQDELNFTGTDATFDINTSILNVDGVPFVKSADAKIIPGDGKLEIGAGGEIAELTDATIVADTINEYHVIERATVKLKGRKEYTASGFYVYNVGSHTQEVEFQDIVGTRIGKGNRDKKATATRAEGEVAEGTPFFIDNKTRFYGTINLDAGSKTLFFDGYAKIEAEKLPGAQWFTIRSEGDKKNLALRVAEPKDREGLPLFTGIYLSKPNRQIYPSFVQTLDFRKDHPILDCNELMLYDEVRDVFLFGDSARVYNPALTGGNLMEFDHANGKVSGDGELGLGGRLKYISMKSYGTVEMDLPTGSRRPPEPEPVAPAEKEEEKKEDKPNMFLLEEETKPDPEAADSTATDGKTGITIEGAIAERYPDVDVKAMAAIDLILPNKLVNMMATDIISGGYAAPGLNVVTDKEFYRAGLETLFPVSKEKDEALASLDAAVLRVPEKINDHTFLFSQLNMRWSNDYQSFVTTEKLSGVASIKGNPIAKMLEVRAEVKMTTGGDDRLYIYVKSPSELYYFFGFKDGIMNVVSNNTQFMNELEGMKAKDLIMKMDDGETYEILPVSPGTAQTFLRRVEAAF